MDFPLYNLSYRQVEKLRGDADRAERAAIARWINACRTVPALLPECELLHQAWVDACYLSDSLDTELDRRELYYEDA